MRKKSFLRLCFCIAVALLELPLMAQGVIVYKKDGTRVKFPYETIDSIVTYNVDVDVEDDPVVSPTDARAVDLGLSVKWASCNVGAEAPEEYGDYFAWGETATKSIYTESSSVTYGLSISELESRGIIGADGQLTPAYDAATANWGSPWRMPTSAEIKELLDKCTWSWTTQNGVNGYKVTGPNGNFIFIPVSGCIFDTSLYGTGSFGQYWSATPYDSNNGADYLYLNSDYYMLGYRSRDYGYTVRPVAE